MVRLSTVCRGRGAPERVIDLLLRLQNINITYQRFFVFVLLLLFEKYSSMTSCYTWEDINNY